MRFRHLIGIVGLVFIGIALIGIVANGQSNPPIVQWQSIINTINSIQAQLASLQAKTGTTSSQGGGTTSTPACQQTIALLNGTATLNLACITPASSCTCQDVTPGNTDDNCIFPSLPPGSGTIQVQGNQNDSVQVTCTTSALQTAAPINTLPAQNGDYDAHGFNLTNLGALFGVNSVPFVSSDTDQTVHVGGANNQIALDGSVVSATALGAGSFYSFPAPNSNWTGGADLCQQQWHNYTIRANATLTLSCPGTQSGSPIVNLPLDFNIYQPTQGQTFTVTLQASNGAAIFAGNGVFSSGTILNTCTTNGCLDQIHVVYNSGQNNYIVTMNGNLTAGTSSPTANSCPSTAPVCYYVASAAHGGSDTNNGLSPSAPFLTVAHAETVFSSLAAGAEVLFYGGDTWTNDPLKLGDTSQHSLQGAVGNPIIIGTYANGNKAILDETNSVAECVNAKAPAFPVKYVTLDNFECKGATSQGVVFVTSGGSMPGITVEHFYIHDTGPGCSGVTGSCVGNDLSGGYKNQLDFEDATQGADGVQFLNNIVQWTGGHNCLEVHHDTGAVLVQGNTVGPGCVHVAIDVKGVGSPSHPAFVTNNIATCGFSQSGTTPSTGTPGQGLCGCQHPDTATVTCSQNPTDSFYTENVLSPLETVTYQNNVAYDGYVGFMDCAGGGCSQSGAATGCGMNIKYYNNTAYLPPSAGNSFGWYAQRTCDGSANSGTNALDIRNNIADGGGNMSMSVGTGFSITEDYNDIGGAQGSPGFSVNGSSTRGAHDKFNVNPLYINPSSSPPNFNLQPGSLLINAGLAGLTPGNPNIGAKTQ